MQFRIKITDSPKKVERQILKIFVKMLNDAMQRAKPNIKTRIKTVLVNTIKITDVYQDLRSITALRGEIGLEDSVSAFDPILKRWADSVDILIIPVKITGQTLTGGFDLFMIEQDFSDVLSLETATYDSVNNRGIVTNIPWLEWFLTRGTAFVVKDYVVNFDLKGAAVSISRTGQALMRPMEGGTFAIDDQYAGTLDDNFVTRAVTSNFFENAVFDIIIEEVEKSIR